MTRGRGGTEGELLRAVLAAARVRVAMFDRAGTLLLDPDPNPPVATDGGAPAAGSFFALYGDIPGMAEAVQTAFGGQEARLTRRLGAATYDGRLVPQRGPTGEVDSVLAVATILTEDARVERALDEVQARERGIFTSNMIGLAYWKDEVGFIDANEAFLRIVGYSRDDLLAGRVDWQAMTPPEYRALDQAAIAEVSQRGSCTPYEKEYIRKDGERVAVLLGGASWALGHGAGVLFVVDISDRKRTERARLDAERTLRQVVEAAPIVLWSVDAAGIFTLSMGRGLQRLGLQPGQVVGQSALEMYAGVPHIPAAIRRCLAGEELRTTMEVAGLEFDSFCSPLRDATGAVIGMLGISIDVTDQRRAEAEQERLRAQILQVQKLESLGLLAGGIAHDFNNILTPILAGASAALFKLPADSRAREDLQHVIDAAQRAAALIRQMLAYSGKAHVLFQPLDLSTQVREIAALLEATVPKKVELRLELEPDLPPVEADAAQVQQIVMNLVINGAEAIGDESGTVVVTSGAQELDAGHAASLVAAEGLEPGQYVFLEVRDSGAGMDAETRAKIFDPFFTTKFTGRGLGLAAVLGIVRGHRGAISVASSPGQGTTFKVFLPLARNAVAAPAGPTEIDFRGRGLVLVIDDDARVRAAAGRILEEFGFTVIEASDGQEGVELFTRNADRIALVLLDMTMPRMNGEEAFRILRGVRSDVPVILTSGYDEVEATRRFTAEGLAGFLEKPYTLATLARTLAAVLPTR